MGTERANSKTIGQWSAYLEDLHARIARPFLRAEVRERAYRYVSGLLADVRCNNSWQMAEAIGEVTPRGVQHLLNDAHWDPDAVRDDVLGQVVAHLGDEASGVLVVDETGFLKRGEKSVGVALQYSGKEDVSILGCSSHTIHPQFIAVCSHKWSSERPETERSAET
jgi:SRSO17 transposase